MKKILTILTLILLFSQVNAQIKSVEIKGSSVIIVGVNN
jgi:hypothetical protein